MSGYDGEVRISTKIDNSKLNSQMMQLENRMEKTARKAQDLEAEMRKMEQLKVPTDEYKKMENQFEFLVEKGKKLSESLKNTSKYTPTDEYKDIQKQIDTTASKLNSVRDRMEKFLETGGNTDSRTFKNMEYDASQLENTIEFAKEELLELEQTGKDKQLNKKWSDIKSEMKQTGEEAAKVKSQMRELENSGKDVIDQKSTEKYKKLSEQLRNCNKQMDILQQKHKELAQKQMANLTKSIRKTSGAFSSLMSRFKGITLSLLFFNWITKGFNAMVSAIKAGVQDMAKYSSEFNSKMSEMKSATNLLKDSLGTLSAPIVSALTPAIVNLCLWLTNAINAINKFISAVSGKSTWTRAKKQQKDYAGSLKDTANAAKQAAGALASFDDLNVLQKNDSSGSGSSGSGSSPEYEEVALTEDDFKWIDKVKKAFEGILIVVLAIGAALLMWKVYSMISSLMEISPLLGGIAGAIAMVAGAALSVVSYFHMWKDGVDWKGLIGYIAGVAIAAGGVLAIFGSLAAGIVIIVAAIAGFILSLKDIIENGVNAKNIALLLLSAFGLVAGVFMAFGAPAAAVVGGIIAIIAAMILLSKKSEEIKNLIKSLWEDHLKPFGKNVVEGVNVIKEFFLVFWNAYIRPILEAIGKKWEDLVNNYIAPMVAEFLKLLWSIIDLISALWRNLLVPFINFLIAYIIPTIAPIIQTVTTLVFGMAKMIISIITGLIEIFRGFVDVITGIVNGDWRKACQGIAEILHGSWIVIRGIINAILGGVEVMSNGVVNAANTIIDAFNGLHFNIPDWVPKIGGKNFGFNIAHVRAVNVPRLANGGITTGRTIAEIGEAGTEGVLPLENNTGWMDKFADKLVNRMPSTNTPSTLILEMNGKQFARVQLPYIKAEQQRIGVSVVPS